MTDSNKDTQVLKDSLRRALLQYRKERPNLSLRAIAKNSGVNRYFLMKLQDEQDDSTTLDLKQVLILAKFITERAGRDPNDKISVEVKRAIERAFNLDLKSKEPVLSQKEVPSQDLADSFSFFVVILASLAHGTTRQQIMRILGERGSKILSEFIEKGFLQEESDGSVKIAGQFSLQLSEQVFAQRIPEYLRYFDPKRSGQDRNHIHLVSQGINRDALKQIFKLYDRMYKKLLTILANEENWGSIPYFSFACMDTFLDSVDDEDEKEENEDQNPEK